jgi:hypothetical protein
MLERKCGEGWNYPRLAVAGVDNLRWSISSEACRIDRSSSAVANLSLHSQSTFKSQRLARRERTHVVAERFGITSGRVSQLRRRYEWGWLKFQGEQAA